MRLAILHPAFDAMGGAQFTAARQARLFQGLGAEVRIRTFAYDSSVWSGHVGGVRVDAYAQVAANGEEHDVPFRVDAREVEWALEGLERFDVILAHNFPTNAAVGLSPHSALKLWYCHEPARLLHPKGANPTLWERVRRLRTLRRHAARYFLRWVCLPWLTQPSRRRSAEDDRRGVSRIDEIWANSEFTRDNVLRVFGARAEVVHPMVDFRPPRPRRSGIDRDCLSILALTRLERHKNLDTLLEGFARFSGKRRARLHIVGTGQARAELEQLGRALGLDRSVTFHGYLSEEGIDDLASRCDAFALLPVDEPFGMVFPEAASKGLLLLGPDHGGPLEILDHGRLGQVADAFDADAIAEGLERIWRMTDSEADRMRERAARACLDRFSPPVAAKKMAALLARRAIELPNGR